MALLIDGYEIDIELSADLNIASEVSEYPVEEGADISDHVRAMPVRLRIEGVVSNTPLPPLSTRRAAFSLQSVAASLASGAFVAGAFALPADEARARLMAINEEREPVTVECSHGVFDNMVMESFDPISTTMECLQFSASFIQVTLVKNERTLVLVKTRAKAQNLGHRPPTEAPSAPPPSGAATSMANDIPPSLRP